MTPPPPMAGPAAGPDDEAPARDSRPRRATPTPNDAMTAELDRLEAEVEAIERMHPLEFLRALGLSPPR